MTMNIKLIQTLTILLITNSLYGKLTIWKPPALQTYFEEHPLVYSIASFGKVPYGHSIIGRIFVATPLDACSPIIIPKFDANKDGSPIVLTKRGGCPFATKAWYAQRAGAS